MVNSSFFLAGVFKYNHDAAAKSVAGIGVPNPLTMPEYTHRVYSGNARAHLLSMVARAGLPKGRPGSVGAGTPTLFGLPPNGLGVSGGSLKITPTEAAIWLLPITICTRYILELIRGCIMYDPTPLTIEEIIDQCRALAYAIVELHNPLAKELLTYILWERLNLLNETLETTEAGHE
ncbi:hypothetical protein J2125_001143 [Erwinia toletana]|uniref:Ash family protein n=1 Tax=Winslowiella toletana TaxID=92490 RepID=A0ABS4P7A1_9GAMM|nr:ash family protein [Winslowiella toletana]MBP2167951.1 hypothetical protein [Winslowiella toletana]